MNFSLILPTRGDEQNLKSFLDSIERTTRDKSNIELLLAIDEGRGDIPHNISKQQYSFSITCYERPKTDHFVRDYYNWLANKSTGNNIWTLNDDAFIVTQDWDEKILEKIGTRSIYLVDVNDSSKAQYGHTFCHFPIISRRAVNLLGYFFHPRVRMYPADMIIYDFYKKANCIIDANDIYLVHNHIHESDKSKQKLMDIFEEDKKSWNDNKINMSQEFQRLKYFLQQEQK